MIVSKFPELLFERRLKVADVARATTLSKTTLHKLYNEESTRIDFDTINQICKFLGVGVGDLLQYEPSDVEDNVIK